MALFVIAVLLVQNYLLQNRIDRSQRIQPGDVLAVSIGTVLPVGDIPSFTVRSESKVSRVSGWPITVLENGKIGLPSVGNIDAHGKSVSEIRSEVVSRYAAVGKRIETSDVKIELISKRCVTVDFANE